MDKQHYAHVETPRERFLKEQAKIKEANLKANAVEDGLDPDEVKEIEDEAEQIAKELEEDETVPVDKHVGDKKITVTQAEYLKERDKKLAQKALASMIGLKDANKNHLSKEEVETINKILRESEKVGFDKISPVMVHLLKTKIKLAEEFVKHQVRIKELHAKLLQELSITTDQVVKTKGGVELVDKQILEFWEENEGLVEKEVDSQ